MFNDQINMRIEYLIYVTQFKSFLTSKVTQQNTSKRSKKNCWTNQFKYENNNSKIEKNERKEIVKCPLLQKKMKNSMMAELAGWATFFSLSYFCS